VPRDRRAPAMPGTRHHAHGGRHRDLVRTDRQPRNLRPGEPAHPPRRAGAQAATDPSAGHGGGEAHLRSAAAEPESAGPTARHVRGRDGEHGGVTMTVPATTHELGLKIIHPSRVNPKGGVKVTCSRCTNWLIIPTKDLRHSLSDVYVAKQIA